jgi:pimeloyl-ACP methyl ester carboxylesterase
MVEMQSEGKLWDGWAERVDRRGVCLRVRGDGPNLLLLHGFGVSSYTWRYVVNPLVQHFRVMAADQLGCGSSARPHDADYSLAGHLDRLEVRLQEEGVEEARVMGNSYGATIALALAARNSHMISRLVLAAPAVFVERLPPLIRLLRSPIFGLLAMKVPATMAARFALRRAYGSPSMVPAEAVRRYAREMGDTRARKALRKTALGMPSPDPKTSIELLGGVTQPTLIIWGQQDRILPAKHGEGLRQALPDARLLILQECGHAPQEEKPKEFLKASLQFLTGKNGN